MPKSSAKHSRYAGCGVNTAGWLALTVIWNDLVSYFRDSQGAGMENQISLGIAAIGDLQTKFEAIPDRELHYRLEQIVLLQFASRSREHGDVVYILNPEFSTTIDGDKTVTLSSKGRFINK
jgi:hypothetical protein